ncbi:hypothetical protein VTL71DRAFT_8118 [Oculimacula yallundae]|uniref:Uncharacterized protein n=1 Tax=Oculimacula yallundae TaxID=86028 RepID=A0ABR4CWS4_9HELO
MDTALITFMIQTPHNSQSVNLIGSWDNFTKRYPMERDVRRSRSQWRGCYAFEDIICDGDGETSPKRTGGLKMGSTYYYYIELDDGTEYYDTSKPSTTSCPYLPGQPVNLLFVPIEVQPRRYRSASMSSMANGDIKTMNPAHKFLTPRAPPPPPPSLQRLNTSSSVLVKKRSAHSLSPKAEKSGWAPRLFFGLRLPSSSSSSVDTRGRSSSMSKAQHSRSNASTPNLREEVRKARSVPHTREASPQSFRRSTSREPSPLRHLVQDNTAYTTTVLEIPDEIEEEGEDDDNFASQLNRMSFTEKCTTPLAPPPSALRSPPPRHRSASTPRDTQKPLPQLPEEDLLPQPLRLRPAFSMATLPRSHFSVSTIASPIASPTDSHFSFISEHSISSDVNDDDEDLALDTGSGDEFTYSPTSADIPTGGFSGYSLPESDYASEQTLRKVTPLSQLSQLSPASSRATFGAARPAFEPQAEQMSALQQLLSEMGYLGDVIVK